MIAEIDVLDFYLPAFEPTEVILLRGAVLLLTAVLLGVDLANGT